MTLWTLSTTPLHKIPPLIRAISLMAGGGAVLSLIWHSTTKKTSSGPFWVVGGAMFFTGWCNYFYRVVLLHLFTFVIDANYIVNIKRSNIWWDDKKRTPGLPSKMILINHSKLILPENFKKKFYYKTWSGEIMFSIMAQNRRRGRQNFEKKNWRGASRDSFFSKFCHPRSRFWGP